MNNLKTINKTTLDLPIVYQQRTLNLKYGKSYYLHTV